MNIQAKYIKSSPNLALSPNKNLPEYAFIGRSNVGKSSLINLISNNKNLAKTSRTPGKTKLFNFFLFEEGWYLVDLPGYGYAKISKTERKAWSDNLENYLANSKNLRTLFILIDGNLSPQKIDLAFVSLCLEKEVPFSIVFTKKDKSTQKIFFKNVNDFKAKVSEISETEPNYFTTSASKKIGAEEIFDYIKYLNNQAR